ncbi:hypothetical protein LTR10_016757 [Elasticomyces elasticus]|uniref:Uncharacterized protein n=1 Tax=Exophiala sideris TaxID=1016849 RepID=A0ABR0JMW5_9EURO|nr:hypothetical protein LTR10_016757 [Elasticomyces elasticus]KAK5037761.1 hypothetical protein LTS07_001228 [Exophiala sideris]KAK5043743.1 hypothetical protein LTR13_000097 [Exophiala sideris]KAK5067242.1 hypothetical protein LTR69_001229 [Exophiala sideris]KAK5182575.1 hypothetical protein LTR44_004966 [Eurotiomycetes sp. CCFEE 6388]
MAEHLSFITLKPITENRKRRDDDDDADYEPGRKRTTASVQKTRRVRRITSPRRHTVPVRQRQHRQSIGNKPQIPDSVSPPALLPARLPPSPPSSPPDHTTSSFLRLDSQTRLRVYRHLLVPESQTIRFPTKGSTIRPIHLNPELEPSILFLNRQVYREASQILYSENTFVASDPSQLFLPNGVQGLRRKTTTYIQHLMFKKRASIATLCMESGDTVYEPIWKMMRDYPGFLNLKKITLHREVMRPSDYRMMALQTYLNKHEAGIGSDECINKRNALIHAAAKLAYHTATRDAEFHGLHITLENKKEYGFTRQALTGNVFEVCLTKGDDTGSPANLFLHRNVCTTLWLEREAGIKRAEEAYHEYFERCRAVLGMAG